MTDVFDNYKNVSTAKVTCQYPILAITDMSHNHTDNVKDNGWNVVKPFPSMADAQLGVSFSANIPI